MRLKMMTMPLAAIGLLALSASVFAQSPGTFSLKAADPAAPPPPACSSNFTLSDFAAHFISSAKDGTATFSLTLKVGQTSFDGSDQSQEPKGATSEFHQFPNDLYVEVLTSSGAVVLNSAQHPFKAVLKTSGAGIRYPNPTGGPGTSAGTIYGQATYSLTLPDTLPPSQGGYVVQIWRSQNPQPQPTSTTSPQYLYTFRMGPPFYIGSGPAPSGYDGSWADDIVCGVSQARPPVGQLPEVPWAAALPLLGGALLFGAWRSRTIAR
jgi:hypothetical protein